MLAANELQEVEAHVLWRDVVHGRRGGLQYAACTVRVRDGRPIDDYPHVARAVLHAGWPRIIPDGLLAPFRPNGDGPHLPCLPSGSYAWYLAPRPLSRDQVAGVS